MSATANSLAWGSIALIFLILFVFSVKSYYGFEKKRKEGKLKVQQIWASNMDDIVGIFTQCFKELAIVSILACIISIIAALLPIFI